MSKSKQKLLLFLTIMYNDIIVLKKRVKWQIQI